ncbi:PREDICTED: poly(A) RNA polymerase, mitochondrial [Ceratosolen solmsi marchali]|uniref:Poly(A) RNA polymerase, mitochondrial n=1 Tax=Ceratosolen solmsi marchali TaxID=326594 RepID=A0AAJ7E110_9HYME|nr:PREDICTED: poly(A) RNA polymerase, mitochondrial [Ceratosolen solmsi marchali]
MAIFHKYLYNINFLHTDLTTKETKESKYIMYDDLIEHRRLQAQRSVLIEIQSYRSCNDVHKYCSRYGKIKNIFYYSNSRLLRHFAFIEFEHQEHIDKILSISTHINYEQIIPVHSSNLWYRNLNKSINNTIFKESKTQFCKYTCKILQDGDIIKILKDISTISEQILSLYEATKLNDIGVRLRFYTAYQIERSFHGLFPNIAILPFGSTVNGFGKQNCDLDLSLHFEKEKIEKMNSNLVFHTKYFSITDKHRVQNVMEIIAGIMNICIPGIFNIRKILQARVPIIKFDHKLTEIECDLSMTNTSAYYMSELLYMYGEMDWRVRPLIFTIKAWAKNCSLTKDTAGPWITNFSLSLLVLFFFQQLKILPPLDLLQSCANTNDIRLVDSHIDCTFLRDITKIPQYTLETKEESLEKLLLNFFNYYSTFDFETKAISLRKGKPILKPEQCALYICNPLEINLNVSKNVKIEEKHRIQYEMRNAVWTMENQSKLKNLGLINLIFNRKEAVTVKFKESINIKKIFETDNSIV